VHPGVQLISRDRAGEFALGASKGAPDAVQVADRFHVQKNLSETVERIFQRHREALHLIRVAGAASSSAHVAAPIPRPERKVQQEQSRSRRMQRYEAVREFYLQGVTLSEIARRFQMGRMTVQKFAYAQTYPETAAYRVKAGMLHPYEASLRERWQQGCRNGARLYREVVAMGYPGKRKQVARLVAHLRQQTNGWGQGFLDAAARIDASCRGQLAHAPSREHHRGATAGSHADALHPSRDRTGHASCGKLSADASDSAGTAAPGLDGTDPTEQHSGDAELCRKIAHRSGRRAKRSHFRVE